MGSDIPERSDHVRYDVVMVVGTAFTGSTLLASLLDRHPDMVSVGEATGPTIFPDDPNPYRCSCGHELERCEFWERVADAMAARSEPFGLRQWYTRLDAVSLDPPARPIPHLALRQLVDRSLRSRHVDRIRDRLVVRSSAGARLRTRIARNDTFYDVVRRVDDSLVFVDTSKDFVRADRLSAFSSQRVLVVHLVRDSPGFVHSHITHLRARGKRATVVTGVHAWRRSARAARRIERSLPADGFLRVRYEDLCDDPRRELDRIARRVGLEPFEAPVDSVAPRHVIGNSMRTRGRRPIELDERWRSALEPPELRAVLGATGRLRRLMGYPPDP